MKRQRPTTPHPLLCKASPIGMLSLFVVPVFWLFLHFNAQDAVQHTGLLSPTQLEDVVSKGVLRVATRPNPLTWFQGEDGKISGLEADLVRAFAEHLGVEVEFVVTNTLQETYDLVRHGKVHMAAAGLSVSSERMRQVHFGPSYMQVRQQLVMRQDLPDPQGLEDIGHAYISVIADSSHAETLKQITRENPAIVPQPLRKTAGNELIDLLARQQLDYALVDSSLARWAEMAYPEVKVAFDVGEPVDYAWAFQRTDDDSLRAVAADFLARLKQSGELDRIINRYLDYLDALDPYDHRQFLRDVRYRLPAYKAYFQQSARKHQLDWRLLAAVGYQESKWDPMAIAPTGTRGMMQFTTPTALELGISNPFDAKSSIEGAARYLQLLQKQLPGDIPEVERPWFALAAYNIGIGTVCDAIRRYKRKHKVERVDWSEFRTALLEAAEGSAFNRRRRQLTLDYVDRIRAYFDLMVWVADRPPQWVASKG